MKKEKLLFVIYSSHGGGAEKQLQYILRYIDRSRFEPYIAVFHLTGKERKILPEDVVIYDLSTKSHPATFFLVYKLARLIIKLKPHKILSFMWGANLIAILAGILTSSKVIVSERTYTYADLQNYRFKWIRKKMISFFYAKADAIIAVSENIKDGLLEHFALPSSKIVVINNGVDLKNVEILINQSPPAIGNYILACGSLEKIKNFDFLLEAIYDINEIFNVIIIGQGSQRKYLEEKAQDLQVNLLMPGYITNPYSFFSNAKVFVVTSLYEGFPNVIIEAMACGVPVVSVDCPGGIRDIITHGENGLIVEQDNRQALSRAILEVVNDKEMAGKLIKNANETIKAYDINKIVSQYEDIITKDFEITC
jgi:glycosyltransferase involved in cell wall biosynthesis